MAIKTFDAVPFPYYGGKVYFLKHFKIPKHRIYLEVFGGGASVFWMKPEPAELSVLNDLDKFVFNAWTIVKEWKKVKNDVLSQPWHLLEGDVRQKSINFRCIKAEAEFYQIKNVPDARAFFLFLVRQKFGYNALRWMPNVRFLIKSQIDVGSLFKYYDLFSERLNDGTVILRNEDFRNVINDYRDCEDAFLYLDPPYIQATKSKYYGFSDDKNNIYPEDVANAIVNFKGKWLISYNNSTYVLKAFEKFNPKIDYIKVKYSKKQYCEITLRNYD